MKKLNKRSEVAAFSAIFAVFLVALNYGGETPREVLGRAVALSVRYSVVLGDAFGINPAIIQALGVLFIVIAAVELLRSIL